MSRIDQDKIVHSPDLLFVNFCEKQFGINRGVYNTIESWFYKQGYVDIIQRRELLIQFLRFANQNCRKERTIKFGPGGLVSALNWFFEKSEQTS
ncbi:hypothetical protein [Priestia megaterium]